MEVQILKLDNNAALCRFIQTEILAWTNTDSSSLMLTKLTPIWVYSIWMGDRLTTCFARGGLRKSSCQNAGSHIYSLSEYIWLPKIITQVTFPRNLHCLDF